MALLQVSSISKSFARTPVLQDVSFSVDEGDIVCVLGPSGCGKTTLLRIVAGLETADSGQIIFDGRRLDDIPVHHRGFGLMFQDYALFPHKDVVANVAFGLRMSDLSRSQVEARVSEMLVLVGLVGYERRRVYDLSGGEQQRVALARSLAPGPRLLMLDEPLGSLDRALREELLNELRAILKRVGVTAIYVTHDQQEAFAVADWVIVMNRGWIVQQGTPQGVYCCPGSPWVARFLGLTNLIPGRVVARAPILVETPVGRLVLREEEPVAIGQPVSVLIRPEAARFSIQDSGPGDLIIRGRVEQCSFRGGHYRLVVYHEADLKLSFEMSSTGAQLPQPGETIALALGSEAMSLLSEEPKGGAATD